MCAAEELGISPRLNLFFTSQCGTLSWWHHLHMRVQNVHSTYVGVFQTPWGTRLVSCSHITDDVDAEAAGCYSIICSQLKALWPWFHLTEEVGEVGVKKCSYWSDWISMLPVTSVPNNTCFCSNVLFCCELRCLRFGSVWGSVAWGLVALLPSSLEKKMI